MWRYIQRSGTLLNPDGIPIATGYSGAPGYVNDPKYQDVKDKGPIPCGFYTIWFPRDTETHGPYVLPLTPESGNEMHDRSGFLVHGDSVESPGTASEGCIVLNRKAREEIWNSTDHRLQVVRELEMSA